VRLDILAFWYRLCTAFNVQCLQCTRVALTSATFKSSSLESPSHACSSSLGTLRSGAASGPQAGGVRLGVAPPAGCCCCCDDDGAAGAAPLLGALPVTAARRVVDPPDPLRRRRIAAGGAGCG
jgi:hypothetical protein